MIIFSINNNSPVTRLLKIGFKVEGCQNYGAFMFVHCAFNHSVVFSVPYKIATNPFKIPVTPNWNGFCWTNLSDS